MQLRGVWAVVVLGVLFVSLGANAFLAGWFFERSRGAPWRGGPPGAIRILDDFPPDVRRNIGRQLWQERQQLGASIDELRAKRREITEAMRAPQLDRDAIRARMAELRVLTDRMQQRAQEVIIEALATMSPEERAEIGERRRWREERRARMRQGEDR
jgi:uncharacterized membrane protein